MNSSGGDPGGMIADIASTAFDQTMSNAWNANTMYMQKKQYEQNQWYQYNRYRIAANDMRRAGLNPLLMAKGLNAGNAPSATSGVSYSGKPTAFASGAAQVSQAATAKELALSNIDLLKAKAGTERTLQDKMKFEKSEIDKRKELNQAMSGYYDNQKAESAKRAILLDGQIKETELENIKREAQKMLYKGKSGEVLAIVDYVIDKIGYFIPGIIMLLLRGNGPKKQKTIPMDKSIVPLGEMINK